MGTVMNLRIPFNVVNFFGGRTNIGFSRKAVTSLVTADRRSGAVNSSWLQIQRTMRHPLSADLGTNFTDNRRSHGRYSSLRSTTSPTLYLARDLTCITYAMWLLGCSNKLICRRAATSRGIPVFCNNERVSQFGCQCLEMVQPMMEGSSICRYEYKAFMLHSCINYSSILKMGAVCNSELM